MVIMDDNNDDEMNLITIAMSANDTDGDGVNDDIDAFPNDATESVDSDNDGIGDNHDLFPNDPSRSVDIDSLVPEFINRKSKLFAWYDTTNIRTFMKNNNNKVRKIIDWSGNNHHFNQEDTQLQPDFNTTEQSLEFSGTEYMTLNQSKTSQKTIFIIFKGSGPIFGDSTLYIHPSMSDIVIGDGTNTEKQTQSTGIDITKKNIIIYTDNGSNIKVRHGLNTIYENSSTNRESNDSTIYIGKSGKQNSNFFNGILYELIIFDELLPNGEIESIHNYLSNKWLLTTSLPNLIEISINGTSDGLGTFERPMNSIKEALKRLRSGGKLEIKSGQYNEPLTITNNAIIESSNGTVIIGTKNQIRLKKLNIKLESYKLKDMFILKIIGLLNACYLLYLHSNKPNPAWLVSHAIKY